MSADHVETLRRMGACTDGRESTRHYATTGEWWEQTVRLDWMLWLANNLGIADGPAMRLFAVWCARQVQHLNKDPRVGFVLDVAERHAAGLATDAELAAALAAAGYAAGDAALAAQRTKLREIFPASQINRLWAIKAKEVQGG